MRYLQDARALRRFNVCYGIGLGRYMGRPVLDDDNAVALLLRESGGAREVIASCLRMVSEEDAEEEFRTDPQSAFLDLRSWRRWSAALPGGVLPSLAGEVAAAYAHQERIERIRTVASESAISGRLFDGGYSAVLEELRRLAGGRRELLLEARYPEGGLEPDQSPASAALEHASRSGGVSRPLAGPSPELVAYGRLVLARRESLADAVRILRMEPGLDSIFEAISRLHNPGLQPVDVTRYYPEVLDKIGTLQDTSARVPPLTWEVTWSILEDFAVDELVCAVGDGNFHSTTVDRAPSAIHVAETLANELARVLSESMPSSLRARAQDGVLYLSNSSGREEALRIREMLGDGPRRADLIEWICISALSGAHNACRSEGLAWPSEAENVAHAKMRGADIDVWFEGPDCSNTEIGTVVLGAW